MSGGLNKCKILLSTDVALAHVQVFGVWGIHTMQLPDLIRSLGVIKLDLFFQIIFVFCILMTKISIAFYILRIKGGRKMRIFFSILLGVTSLVTVTGVVVSCTACYSLKDSHKDDCAANGILMHLASAHLVITLLSDLCLTASPIFILWKVQIKTWQKIKICGLMSLGLVATVASVIRFCYQLRAITPFSAHQGCDLSDLVIGHRGLIMNRLYDLRRNICSARDVRGNNCCVYPSLLALYDALQMQRLAVQVLKMEAVRKTPRSVRNSKITTRSEERQTRVPKSPRLSSRIPLRNDPLSTTRSGCFRIVNAQSSFRRSNHRGVHIYAQASLIA